MIKEYKGFYPSWYIEKKNNEKIKKVNKYLMLILAINIFLVPKLLKKPMELIENEKQSHYKKVNVLDGLGFLLENNIINFTVENNKLEFKIDKNDFKNSIKLLEKKIDIDSVEEVFEENTYLIKGEYYDK